LGEVVELKIVHGRDLALVKVDVNQFEQVVINLCVNARDAMPDGGVLTLNTSNVTARDVEKSATKPVSCRLATMCCWR
jgi:two-component system cell cycle sensor histidine kinase/response regulator CckA